MTAATQTVSVIDSAFSPELSLVIGDSHAKAVVSPATGAIHRTMNYLSLGGAARTVTFRHDQDAAYYIISGGGLVVDQSGDGQSIRAGSMVHVDAGDAYHFAAGPDGLVVIGGPCPADASLYSLASDL